MLRWRLLLGAVLIGALAALVRLDLAAAMPGVWLFPLVLVVAVAAAAEVVSLLAAGGYHPLRSVIYGGTLLVVASNAVAMFCSAARESEPLARLAWPFGAFVISFLAALVGEIVRYRQPGGVIANVALATFGVAYVGVLLSFGLQLRVLGGSAGGMTALVATIVVVKLGDTGAYTVGRLVGRHRMAPHLSPGKTIEGGAGHLAFACLGAWLALEYVPNRLLDAPPLLPAWGWLAFGLVVGLAGLVGDLAESLLKRDMGRKDSSTWLPGFGGVLDIIDSILFAAPVAYFCWLLLENR